MNPSEQLLIAENARSSSGTGEYSLPALPQDHISMPAITKKHVRFLYSGF